MSGFDWSYGDPAAGQTPPSGEGDPLLRSSSEALGPGARVAEFTVLGQLGQGGMGVVYRARDERSGREVALKLLKGEVEDARLERFRREGRVTAALRHPGIVRVHGAGVHDGRPYLAYALVEDPRPLDRLLLDKTRTLRDRVELIAEAAEALGYAHAAGVVHRDVKPDNLLVDKDGRVQVTDFGLALVEGVERLTQTGALVGTPTFMSPEQFQSARSETGPQVDVWALGVLLYLAATDRFPFDGATLQELGARICSGTYTPPRRLDPTLPSALEAVIQRSLELDPKLRYPEAGALHADLRRFLDEGTSAALSSRSWTFEVGRRSRWLLPLTLLAVVIVLVSAVAQSDWRPAEPSGEGPGPSPGNRPLDPGLPAWFRQLPAERRPPLPLRDGLEVTDMPGVYRWTRDGSELVWVPPGATLMGIPSEPTQPRKNVGVAGFFIGRYEVRRQEWSRFQEATRHPELQASRIQFDFTPSHPIAFVAWDDAQAYCKWAGLRLATEAEWDLAARSPEGRSYPWSSPAQVPEFGRANYLETAYDPYVYLAPCGSFPDGVSWCGAFDLAGNVEEWVEEDSQYPYSGGKDKALVRGRHAYAEPSNVARRNDAGKRNPHEASGFRVALAAGRR